MGSAPIDTMAPAPDGTWMHSVSTFTAEDVFLVGTTTNPPIAGPLLNISTRLQVLTADQVPIGGFIVTGNEPKNDYGDGKNIYLMIKRTLHQPDSSWAKLKPAN